MGNYEQKQRDAVQVEPQPIKEDYRVSEFAGQVAEDLFNRYSNGEIREFLEELKKHCVDRLAGQVERARFEHERLDVDFGILQKEI